jgi:hypothetical protein
VFFFARGISVGAKRRAGALNKDIAEFLMTEE